MMSTTIKLLVLCFVFFVNGCSDTSTASSNVKYQIGPYKFDIPLKYHFKDFIKFGRDWPSAPKKRKKLDVLEITALLPDLVPYTEENKGEFDQLGWGNKIRISVNRSTYDGEKRFRRRVSLTKAINNQNDLIDENALYSSISNTEIWLLTDAPFTKISCSKEKSAPYPYCNVLTNYKTIEIEYSFSRDYLPDWKKIDLSVKRLIESFEEKIKGE